MSPPQAFGLIARREVTSRLQQRGFRISFAVALLVVVLACVLPSFFRGGNGTPTYDVGVATPSRGLSQALTAVGAAQHVHVRLHPAGVADARAQVRDGAWDVAVLPGDRLLVHAATDGSAVLVRTALQLAGTLERLRAAGLTPTQAAHALSGPPARIETVSSSRSGQRKGIAIVAVVLLFSQLVTFVTWVATGVVEEKASRVVELLLACVRPSQLLAGKLVGIGLLAAAQVLVIGLVALVAATSAGTVSVPASAITVLIGSFVGFLLGFAFFAALGAAAASTVSRQEEVSGVLAPISLTLTVSYLAAFTVAASPGSTAARVLSLVPPVSAMAMPARLAGGGVPVLDVVLAVVLLIAAAVGVLALAARIYRASILHSGTRVSLRRAWRGDVPA